MRYFYEYKEKDGCRVAGHNLEKIIIKGNKIVLQGVDIIQKYQGVDYKYWGTILDKDEIEYLKIEPMQELENK